MSFYKRLLLVGSAITLALLVAAAVRENFFTEWRHWQRAYRHAAVAAAKTPAKRARTMWRFNCASFE